MVVMNSKLVPWSLEWKCYVTVVKVVMMVRVE